MAEIRFLHLLTARLRETTRFYQETLQLPLLASGPHFSVLAVGSTTLMWQETAESQPFYHFALDLPCNQLDPARQWLQARLDLLPNSDGQPLFRFDDWNADSVYFHDPDGNIVEGIARHNLANSVHRPFGPESWLRISEIGWPTDDLEQTTRDLQLPSWRDYGAFRAVGSETGLVLLVPPGRGWLPTRQPAEIHPCSLSLEHQGRFIHLRR